MKFKKKKQLYNELVIQKIKSFDKSVLCLIFWMVIRYNFNLIKKMYNNKRGLATTKVSLLK